MTRQPFKVDRIGGKEKKKKEEEKSVIVTKRSNQFLKVYVDGREWWIRSFTGEMDGWMVPGQFRSATQKRRVVWFPQ